MVKIDGAIAIELACTWRPPVPVLELSMGVVDIWRIRLGSRTGEAEELQAILSSEEQKRARRFLRDEHRRRYIVAHGTLRKILGRYLNVEPEQLKFSFGPKGKPSLLLPQKTDNILHFNLSHSQDLALCAVTCDDQIGVDLEHIDGNIDIEAVARRFFLYNEYTAIRCLSQEQRKTAFFTVWTLKEAFLKATGQGLANLDKIGVDLRPGKLDPVVGIHEASLGLLDDWSFHLMTPALGYAGCVVVGRGETPCKRFRTFEAAISGEVP